MPRHSQRGEEPGPTRRATEILRACDAGDTGADRCVSTPAGFHPRHLPGPRRRPQPLPLPGIAGHPHAPAVGRRQSLPGQLRAGGVQHAHRREHVGLPFSRRLQRSQRNGRRAACRQEPREQLAKCPRADFQTHVHLSAAQRRPPPRPAPEKRPRPATARAGSTRRKAATTDACHRLCQCYSRPRPPATPLPPRASRPSPRPPIRPPPAPTRRPQPIPPDATRP